MNKIQMRLFLVLGIAIALLPVCVFAQDSDKKMKKNSDDNWFNIDFDMLHSNNEGDIQPRIDIDVTLKEWAGKEKKLTIGAYYLQGDIKGKIVHTWGTNLDTEPSVIQASGGFFWNMKKFKEVNELPPLGAKRLPEEENTGFMPVPNNVIEYNYGQTRLKVNFLAETDDDADNVLIAGGVEAVYSSEGTFDNFILPLPSFLLAYEYANPVDAEAREALGVETSSFPRFRGAVLWNWDFGQDLFSAIDIAKDLSLHLHYRYAKEFDQDTAWRDRGYDEYDQVNLRFIYRFSWEKVKKLEIRNIFAGYSYGRQIAHTENDRRLFLGITIQ